MVSIGPAPGGDTDEYPQIKLGNDKFSLCNGYTVIKGRDLSYLDIEKLNQVCVLGSATAEYLFSFADPIDKTITINGRPFRVVGVYQSKSANLELGTSEEAQWMQDSIKWQDRMVLLPSTMTRYFNNNESVSEYVVKVKSADAIKKAISDLNGFLSGIINTDSGGFNVYSEDTWQNQSNEANALQQRFLGGIAAISLLVGGIGIMNIMLVTVTERTREIGIRKAIGAERRSIITQFLIEAAMICGIGGIFGIGVGYLGTLVVGKLSFGTILVPSATITVGAFLISVVLGIIFGLYPAIKASGLQPVDALRAE
jgi:putative ABC transport system permease protein